MDLSKIKALKADILDELYSSETNGSQKNTLNLNFQTSVDDVLKKPEKRISIGYSRQKGNKYRLEILVDKENDKAHLAAELIKKKYTDKLVNVQVTGMGIIPTKKAVSESKNFAPFCERNDKLHIGLSISHKESYPGTLGAFVANRKDEPCILSCNHVLAKNGELFDEEDKTSRKVFHPGNIPNRPAQGGDYIADVEDWVEMKLQQSNSSDSAYAKMIKSMEYLGNIVPTGYGFPHEGVRIHELPIDFVPNFGTEVYKIGRSTGYTVGKISAWSVDSVPVQSNKVYIFDNVIKIDWLSKKHPFSVAGDSGSLVYLREKGKLYALGMIFSGVKPENLSNKIKPYSFACALKDVLVHNKIKYL